MRAWLGGRYDVFTPAVARLIAQRPGMRLAMEDRDGDALRAELTAVCAYLGDNLVPLDGDGDALRAYLSCAAAGLRRLPSYPGAMFCPAVDADMRWRRGAIVTAREFLTGTADVRVRFGDAEWVVWSTSGRRLDGLVAAPRRHEVVLGPGTGFAVLAVEPAADGRPARVFLGELPAGGARGDGTRWERMVERLRAAAERRDAVPEAERISAPEVRRPRLTAGAYLVERHDDSSEGPGRRAE